MKAILTTALIALAVVLIVPRVKFLDDLANPAP